MSNHIPEWTDWYGRPIPRPINPTPVQVREYRRAYCIDTIMAYVVLWLCATPFIFFALYIVKSLLGIDIFPDHHLGDFL